MVALLARMLRRRGREEDEDRVDAFISRHLASPRMASMIRFTLPVRSLLLMIQQVTPIRRTPRKTTAASVGIPSRARKTAGSSPPAARPASLRALFTALRPYDAESAMQRPPGGCCGTGGAHTAVA